MRKRPELPFPQLRGSAAGRRVAPAGAGAFGRPGSAAAPGTQPARSSAAVEGVRGRGTPSSNAAPCEHQHCPYPQHSAPAALSAWAGAAGTGCGRAALPVPLGCGPSSPAKPELGPRYFYLLSVNSFLDSCINPEKVAFSSHPLKSLNFPSASTHVPKCSFPAGQKKPKQNQTRIPGGEKGNKPKPTK